jgi:hypothetical protein
MKFTYFTLPDGSYLAMNNLRNSGEFTSNSYSMPSMFPYETKIEDVFHKVQNKPDIKTVLTKTFTV